MIAAIVIGVGTQFPEDPDSGISEYLLIVVKVAHGDASAVEQIPNDNTYLEDSASLSASVPLTICQNH